jgi:DNA-binding MarR family transcriptional regulator
VDESHSGSRAVADQGAEGLRDLDEQTASRAVLTVLRLFRALERVDTGLTPQQYRILKLAGAGGERSARLAERLAVAKPTLTATADGLVAAGYVQRETEPGDRRVVRLCLTATGRAALERADSAYAEWLGSLLGAEGARAEMLRALQTLDAAMDERRQARLAERCATTGSGVA